MINSTMTLRNVKAVRITKSTEIKTNKPARSRSIWMTAPRWPSSCGALTTT